MINNNIYGSVKRKLLTYHWTVTVTRDICNLNLIFDISCIEIPFGSKIEIECSHYKEMPFGIMTDQIEKQINEEKERLIKYNENKNS